MFKKLSLGKKLLLAFLVVGILPFTAISVVSLKKAERALSEQAFAKLTAVRDIKKKQIQDYIEVIGSQMRVFSSSTYTIDALLDFSDALAGYAKNKKMSEEQQRTMKTELKTFYQGQFAEAYRQGNNGKQPDAGKMLHGMDMDAIALQYDYIVSNEHPIGGKHLLQASDKDFDSNYASAHRGYHPTFFNQMERFGYSDIYIVKSDTGRVVYSVHKNTAFGTSLINGPYAETALGRAFKEVMANEKVDEILIVDFEPFLPGLDKPVAFIASPVFDREDRIGVAVFELPLDLLNGIMTARAGMGETGETYLVGSDGLMRSDSRLDPEHRSVENAFQNPEAGKVDTDAARLAFQGKTGLSEITNYIDKKVLSAYAPVSKNGLNWALLAEIEMDEAFGPVTALKNIMGVFAVIALVAVVTVAWLVARAIVKPVKKVVDGLTELSQGEGDLTLRLPIGSSDEIGVLSQRFNEFMEKLHSMMQEISNSILTLSGAATDLTGIAGQMTETAEETAEKSDAVESAAIQMNQNMVSISGAMEQSATNANTVAASAEEMSSTIHKIADSAGQASAISGNTVAQAGVAGEKMAELNLAAQSIDKVTRSITDILEQTSLLALNATIEAARAGEAGKGFAVVANEIKELAHQTAEATLDIKDKVESVQLTTDASVKEIDEISKFIGLANDAISGITEAVSQQSHATEEIASNIAQVSMGITEVNTKVADSTNVSTDISDKTGSVNKAAVRIAGSSELLSKSSLELSDLSQNLEKMVGRFKM